MSYKHDLEQWRKFILFSVGKKYSFKLIRYFCGYTWQHGSYDNLARQRKRSPFWMISVCKTKTVISWQPYLLEKQPYWIIQYNESNAMAAILIWQNSIVIAAIMVGKQRIMQNEKLIHSFSKTKHSKTKGKVVILNVLKFPLGHKNHGLLKNKRHNG